MGKFFKWKKLVDKYFIKFQFNLIYQNKKRKLINLLEKLKTTIHLFHKRRNKRKKERKKHFIIKMLSQSRNVKKTTTSYETEKTSRDKNLRV